MTSPAPRDPSLRSRAGAAGRGPAGPAGRRPGPPRPAGRAEGTASRLHRLAAGFAQAFLEVECGRRPRSQLHAVLCPRLADRLADIWVRPGPPGKVVRISGVQVAPGRYEAVAVVRRGQRFGALVVTLVRTGRRWRVVEAARPEDARPLAEVADDAQVMPRTAPPAGDQPGAMLAVEPAAR